MNEYDKKAKKIIYLARKSLKELERKIGTKNILPEMLDERIKLLIWEKIELYNARIIDLGIIYNCEENKEEQEETGEVREEIGTPQEIKKTKKRISYSRV